MNLEFTPELRGQIFNEIARWMGVDGQDAMRGPHEKVTLITVTFVDEHEHEHQITEIKDNELNGQAGMDGIMRIIESAVMRDALTRFGNCLYALYFHLAQGQMNRGRFPFLIPGSGHMYRAGANQGGGSFGLARYGDRGGGLRRGGFDGGDGGPADLALMIKDALTIVPQLLEYVAGERKQNDERIEIAFKSQQDTIRMQNEIITEQNAREMRIRELENELLDRRYEIEKKRKKEEIAEKRWDTAWEMAIKYGMPLLAMLTPPLIEAIRKLNNGPNYVPNEMNFEKVQELIQQMQNDGGQVNVNGHANGAPNGAPQNGAPQNGAPHANGAPQNGAPHAANGAPPPNGAPAAAAGAAPPEGNPLDMFHKRIAMDLVRFMGLVRMKGHVDLIKDAIGVPEIVALYEEIVQATVTADATDENVMKLAQLALQLGGALMQHQDIAIKIYMSVDGFEREAMQELVQLLQQYGMFVQHLAAQQHGGGPQGPPSSGGT